MEEEIKKCWSGETCYEMFSIKKQNGLYIKGFMIGTEMFLIIWIRTEIRIMNNYSRFHDKTLHSEVTTKCGT